ncbi:hypothetical protein AVEN_263717-1 [Araneus ventricosus]|uniref:Uncharacterized protein n=1 Tax=Araneus ventricosus TaxID=182803 RepID=A0A4Y2ARZ6_ARAVE|nr:hypothetical protein AVEN_263717-1 [Araneus ventricosus]
MMNLKNEFPVIRTMFFEGSPHERFLASSLFDPQVCFGAEDLATNRRVFWQPQPPAPDPKKPMAMINPYCEGAADGES